MKWRVILEPEPETIGLFSVPSCCTSAGETEEEALENIREAIELYLQPDDLQLPAGLKSLKRLLRTKLWYNTNKNLS